MKSVHKNIKEIYVEIEHGKNISIKKLTRTVRMCQ